MIPYQEERLPPVQTLDFSVDNWRGLNRTKGNMSQGEMWNMKNMSSDNYPYSGPRKSREVIKSEIINPQNIINANSYIANGKFYYNGEEKGEVGEVKTFVNFNDRIITFPNTIAYDTISDEYETIGGEISFLDTITTETDTYEGIVGKTYKLHSDFVKLQEDESIEYTLSYKSTSDWKYTTNLGTGTTCTINLTKFTVNFYNESNTLLSGTDVNWTPYEIKLPFTKPANATKVKIKATFYVGNWKSSHDQYLVTLVEEFANQKVLLTGLTTEEMSGTGFIPNIDYSTVFNNRIVGIKGSNIYVSGQGDYKEWSNFADEAGNPNATGAYVTDVGSEGDFTGCYTYKNHVLMFKPDYVYEMYGEKNPFRIIEISKIGCVDGRTICEVDGVLYWLSRNGIVAYAGGQPRIISQKLNKTFVSGVAGIDGRKYYCSLYDGTNYYLYVYDTYNGMWHIEDNIEVVGFAYSNGFLYALTRSEILKFNSGNERIEWEFETQDYTFGIPETKNVAKLYIRVEMKPNTNLDVYIRSNNGEYNRVANYQADNQSTFDFKVRVKKCDTFSIKFKGYGDVRVLDIHGKVIVGTSKHRSGNNLSVFRG